MMEPRRALGLCERSDVYTVTRAEILAFAAATSDDNTRFTDEAGEALVAPPVYTARYFNPLILKILASAGADFSRLLFGEMDYRYHRAISPGLALVAELSTTALEEKTSGQLLHTRARVLGANDGVLHVEGVASFFVRAKKKPGAPKVAKLAPAAQPERVERARVELATREDQALLFSKAAKDPNPIHIDERIAKAAGLGGVIMHGLCTMAFCGRVVLRELCDSDPTRLTRLAVRFSKPARPGMPLTIRVFEPASIDEPKNFTFLAENNSGLPVITGGIAETR